MANPRPSAAGRRHLGAAQRRSLPATTTRFPPEGCIILLTRKSPRQPRVRRLWKTVCHLLHDSHFIRAGRDPVPAGRPPVYRSAHPSVDGPYDGRRCAVPDLHTRVGVTPAAAATHGTAADAVQPATSQTPTASALEPLHPWAWPPSASTIAPRRHQRYRLQGGQGRRPHRLRDCGRDAPEWEDTWRLTAGIRDRFLQLSSRSCQTRAACRLLVQDWYKGAPLSDTTNICLPSGLTATQ